jgi:hypothetical protein
VSAQTKPDDYMSRVDYPSAVTALADARRVLDRLRSLAAERTVLTYADVDFLTRRADALLVGCITAHERGDL